jgi:hypothetical protein
MKHWMLRILSPTWQAAWAITLISLPITSFPLLSRATGGTLVAPLAILPLSWLCLTFLPVYLFSRKPLPAETRSLVFFLILALVSSASAYFLDVPTFKGYTLFKNNLEAFVTLGIGLAFFFTTLFLSRSTEELKATLKFVNVGGTLVVLWSLIQIGAAWIQPDHFPAWIVTIQSQISITSIQGNMTRFRVPGTTLEPSWLAHCLNILYLSTWLAATTKRYSVFHLRIIGLTVENILLVAGIVVLIFTYSRIGLLAFGLVLVWFMLLGSKTLAGWLSSRFFYNRTGVKRTLQILLSTLLMVALILVLGGLAYRLSFDDPRFASFFGIDPAELTAGENFMAIANQLSIAERAVYWDLGWKVFEAHPVLGVGLGNAGMFTLRDISFYAWKLPEVRHVLFLYSNLPNTKNLWTRLLAETGLVGFSLFTTWLVVLWMAARRLQDHALSLLNMLGLAGQFSLIALLLEGFSIDTFALPYIWVALGLLTAASFLGRRHPYTAETATFPR